MRTFVNFIFGSLIPLAIVFGALYFLLGESSITCTVDGEPSECDIFKDGEYLGKTPYKTRFGSGQHAVEVRPPVGARTTHERFELTLTSAVIGGDFSAPFLTVSKVPVDCYVDGYPIGGCMLEVDGEYKGETPLDLHLGAGDHQVVVVGPEDPLTEEVEITFTNVQGGSKIAAKFTKFRD